ncbi:hypothetical protein ACOSQ2_029636 [Xanthoceras sorbifolium]
MTSLSLNVGNFVTLKLTQSNYPLWREQVLGLAESQDLVGHLTNETPIPTKYTTSDSNTTETGNTIPQLTTKFVAWQKSDRLLRGWIIRTLSEKALGLVIGLDTALATIGDHIRIFKGLCDNLAAIGKPIPDKEKVLCLLTSLGPQYETFTTMMLKPPRLTYSELISQLQNLDQRRHWFSNQLDASLSQLTPHFAFYGQQQKQSQSTTLRNHNNTFTSLGRGFQAQQFRNQNQSYPGNSTPATQ